MHTKPVRTGVGVDGARYSGTIAVLDGEGAALLDSGRGRRRRETMLALADRASAGRARDPEVR